MTLFFSIVTINMIVLSLQLFVFHVISRQYSISDTSSLYFYFNIYIDIKSTLAYRYYEYQLIYWLKYFLLEKIIVNRKSIMIKIDLFNVA